MLVYLGSFDLKVNFPRNRTKKLQRPAKQGREAAREGGGMAFLLLADQKFRACREGCFAGQLGGKPCASLGPVTNRLGRETKRSPPA